MLIGIYSGGLVLVSLFVAMFASYTALDMAGRITASQTRFAACLWLGGGSFAMGLGIWSMHFIGMLAYKLPVPMGYDVRITSLSLLIAIASSGFALWLVSQNELSWGRLSAGAVLMGSGVAAMHYTGMAAMRMSPGIQYTPSLFALSILIAISASGAALRIAFHLRGHSSRVRLLRVGSDRDGHCHRRHALHRDGSRAFSDGQRLRCSARRSGSRMACDSRYHQYAGVFVGHADYLCTRSPAGIPHIGPFDVPGQC